MPYYADQRADLERQLHTLDPDLTLPEPEDPGFSVFLARVTNLDANLARNIDKAIVDEQAEEARDLFGQASRKGNATTVLSKGMSKTKGRSVRGDRRVRPATFAAAAGGLLALAIGITALMPEKASAQDVPPNQTATVEPGAKPTEEVPANPLPESVEDTTPRAESTDAPPITPASTAEVSEPAPAPIPDPAPITAAPAPAPVPMPAPSPAPLALTPEPEPAPAPTPPAPDVDLVPLPAPIPAPRETPRPVRITPSQTATTSNTVPGGDTLRPPTAPATAFTSTRPPAPQPPAAGTAQPGAVVSGVGKAPVAQTPAPEAAVVMTATPAQAAPSGQNGAQRGLTATAAAPSGTSTPRTGLVASTPAPAAALPARTGLVSEQSGQGAAQPPRWGMVSSASGQGTGAARTGGLTSSASGSTATAAGDGVVGSGAAAQSAPTASFASASTDGGSGLAQAASPTYAPGTVVMGELTTAVAVYPGATHPVWVQAEDGSMWRGSASVDEKTDRIVMTFAVVLHDGRQVPVTAYAESTDGPGIGGRTKQVTPNAARAAVNGVLTGLRTFAESQAARTTTVTPTGVVSTAERPQNFWMAVGGALANAFVVPETRANVVPLGQIAAGERVYLRVDMPQPRS